MRKTLRQRFFEKRQGAEQRFLRGYHKQRMQAILARNPNQARALLRYMKTGEHNGLRASFLQKITPTFFDFQEARSRLSKKPYFPVFSTAEKKEIRQQFTGLLEILYPNMARNARTRLLKLLLERTEPIQRKHITEELERTHEILPINLLETGRVYLNALRPSNKEKGTRKLGGAPIALKDTHQLILGRGWMENEYEKTAPIHEAAHFLLGKHEGKAYTVDYYYALKKGSMSVQSLKKYTPSNPEEKEARDSAIRIYRIGLRNGWRAAEEELRRIVFGIRR